MRLERKKRAVATKNNAKPKKMFSRHHTSQLLVDCRYLLVSLRLYINGAHICCHPATVSYRLRGQNNRVDFLPKMSEYVGLTTRSRSKKSQLISPSNSQGTFADENACIHPNKRVNVKAFADNNSNKKKISREDERPLGKENINIATAVVMEPKKMKISADEMSMNGAPAGDLYDVQVLSDSEIICFSSTKIAQTSLEAALALKKESSSWADMFTAVEVIRRVTLHHPKIISRNDMLSMALEFAIDAISSLRSSTIRNGIACIRSLTSLNLQPDSIREIIQVLICRTSSGPKFICEEANKVLDELIKKFPPLLCMEGVSNSTNNRNNDISSKAYLIISESVERLFSTASTSNFEPDENLEIASKYDEILRYLSRGLSARSPAAREVSKNALRTFKTYLGDEVFASILLTAVDELVAKEVKRILIVDVKSIHSVEGTERPTFKMREVFTKTSVRPLSSFTASINKNGNGDISTSSASVSSSIVSSNVAVAPRISIKERMLQQKEPTKFISSRKSTEMAIHRIHGSVAVVATEPDNSDNPFSSVDI